MLEWSAEDRTQSSPLVFLAFGDALHTGRDGAWLKRLLIEHDDQLTMVVHVERFVEKRTVQVASTSCIVMAYRSCWGGSQELRLSGDPKLLFDLTPSEHTIGRFSTRVAKKHFRCVQAQRGQKMRHLPQSSGGRSVEAKVAIRATPGSEGPCWRKDASLPAGRGKMGFSAHVSGPDCFGNVSRRRKKKSSRWLPLRSRASARCHKRS